MIAACVKSASLPSPAATTSRRVGPSRPASWLPPPVGSSSRAGVDFNFTWYPPLKFDPSRTLAQQVRRGPRAAADAVRIEPDGRVIPPIGPAVSGGNMLQDDWKPIARSEVFRALKRRREAAARCAECPGLAACAGGCLRNTANWAEEY